MDEVLLFMGEANSEYKKKYVEFKINGHPHNIYVVGNPMLDESGNFDPYIKSSIDKKEEIFYYKDICTELVRKVDANKSSGTNSALYKHYGKIIAYRNRFKLYYPKKPYQKDTYYFISHDKKYIISIDLKHGHFEVFDNTNRQLWIAKYSFSGEVINAPKDPKIL